MSCINIVDKIPFVFGVGQVRSAEVKMCENNLNAKSEACKLPLMSYTMVPQKFGPDPRWSGKEKFVRSHIEFDKSLKEFYTSLARRSKVKQITIIRIIIF